MIRKHIFFITFLNGPENIFSVKLFQAFQTQKKFYLQLTISLRTVKRSQVLLFKTNNSIQQYLLLYTQLNGPKHCYESQTIQLDISHLFTHS